MNKSKRSAIILHSFFILIFTSSTLCAQESQVVDSLPGGDKIVIAGKKYNRGALHEFLWGKHYRQEWSTPVKVKLFDIDKVYGGLKPILEGGGRQTKTLRLKAANGKEYVLRSIDKSFGKALPEIFQGTFIEAVANDQASVAHPYSAVTVPALAQSANIFHTNPSIVFLPESKTLGEYNKKFANQIFLFEERPDGDQSDAPNFGWSDDVDGTEKMLANILSSNDHRVDQEAYVRARLFDMFLSDWGRHEDQWRWASFKGNDGITIYKPIPRDRDQTYTRFDGFLVGLFASSSAVGFLQSFDYMIKDVKKFNYQARHLDRILANEPSLEAWSRIAKELQASLPDSLIERSVRKLPGEVLTISGQLIIDKLKSRRDHLLESAIDYYKILSKEVEITASSHREIIEINGASKTETKVNLFRMDENGLRKQLLYSRTFKSAETKEIRIYGIGGQDQFVIYGNPTDDLRIRLIGGAARDSFINQSNSTTNPNLLIYDNADNYFSNSNRFKMKLSSDTLVHKFDYNGYKDSKSGITKGISYNNEDELFVSLGYGILKQKWRKQPFAASHNFKVNYSLTQNAFSAQYKSIFTELIAKSDLVFYADWDQDRSYHFPGIGNNTTVPSKVSNYYRTRFREFSGGISLERRFAKYHKIGLGGFYQNVKVLQDTARFVSKEYSPFIINTFVVHQYAGARLYYNFEHFDDLKFPSKGLRFALDASYSKNLDVTTRSFTKYGGIVGFYLPLLKSVTLAVKGQGSTLDGEAEFFQLPRLGGGSTLRGFLRHRFFGKTAFSNQNELQWNIDFRSYLFNGKIGLLGILDNGRVWVPGETSDKWHIGVGGGLMIAPFNMFSITGSYTRSDETGRINIRVGRLI